MSEQAEQASSGSGVADQRRAQMLRAALEVIADRGFADTRISDIADRIGISPALVIYYFKTKCQLLTEAISNSAAVAIMLPMAIPLGSAAGFGPVLIALAVGIVSGFAFMLPMGTPANAMVFGAGYVDPRLMARYGIMMSASALVLFLLTARFWWPLAGIGIR